MGLPEKLFTVISPFIFFFYIIEVCKMISFHIAILCFEHLAYILKWTQTFKPTFFTPLHMIFDYESFYIQV